MKVLLPDGMRPSADPIMEILQKYKTIAVVGLSSNPARTSFEVTQYMQGAGYRIIPVNPNEKEVLGEKSYARLEDVPLKIEIVDVFRRAGDGAPGGAGAGGRVDCGGGCVCFGGASQANETVRVKLSRRSRANWWPARRFARAYYLDALWSVRERKDYQIAFAREDDGQETAVGGDVEFADRDAAENWLRRRREDRDVFEVFLGSENGNIDPDEIAGFSFGGALQHDAVFVGGPV